MPYIDPEKREYERLKHHFTVRFRIRQEENTKEPFKWDLVTLRNLSASGISFNFTEKIPLGTVLEFDITVPFTKEAIHCEGVVCRVDEESPEKRDIRKIPICGVAVRFTKIESDKKEIIDKLVKKFHSAR